MPRTLTFTGYSDDLVEIRDTAGHYSDEYSAYDGATFHLIHGNKRLQVALGLETLSGCWHATIGQVDETAALPGWPIRIEQDPDTEYSVRVTVEVPEGVELIEIGA
ncbi:MULTISPECIES: hypothetical protein [Rhodococcus]|uniref:hypothetical protein n=1 Tax=Rhodococcus TaxID=1827 RepID=UPI000C7D9D51|nr:MULTISPECIES: hypothetical protein [Rhodococcus]AUM18255.1 hypothetical protein CSW53_18025 [Rhodococcus ruber]